jgi:hypothetical protein
MRLLCNVTSEFHIDVHFLNVSVNVHINYENFGDPLYSKICVGMTHCNTAEIDDKYIITNV